MCSYNLIFIVLDIVIAFSLVHYLHFLCFLSQILHAHYVLEVLFEARKVLKQMPNFSHVKTFPAKEITICGKFQKRVVTLIFRSLLVLHHLPNMKTM